MTTPNESAPAGDYVLVPREMTAAMAVAMKSRLGYPESSPQDTWAATLAAAPVRATGGELREHAEVLRELLLLSKGLFPVEKLAIQAAIAALNPAIAPQGGGGLLVCAMHGIEWTAGCIYCARVAPEKRLPAAGNAVDDASRRTLVAVMALCDQIREESRQPLSQVSDTTACVKSNLRHWLRSPQHFAAALNAAPQDGEADQPVGDGRMMPVASFERAWRAFNAEHSTYSKPLSDDALKGGLAAALLAAQEAARG